MDQSDPKLTSCVLSPDPSCPSGFFILASDVTTLANVLRSVVVVSVDWAVVGVCWMFSRMPWSNKPGFLGVSPPPPAGEMKQVLDIISYLLRV